MSRRVLVGILAACALVAACGGRVSQQQVIAEANEDGSFAAGAGTGAEVSGTGGTASGTGAAAGTGASAAGAAGATAAGQTGGATGAAGQPAGGDPTAAAPPGGNGGATDVGVTEDRIILGNVSTLSGPVPGLFRGALVAAQAWAAMVNSQGGIYGRLVEVRSGDDQLDAGKNKAAHLDLKSDVFGFVGSFSVNDDGSVSELANSGIPDVGFALSAARTALPNNFSPNPLPPGGQAGPANYFAQQYGPDVVKKTAMFVSAVEAARQAAAWQRQVLEDAGWEIVYTREVQPNEPNYTGDIIRMRSAGVRAVVWQGQADQMAALATTMHDQGFEPDLAWWGNDAYSSVFVDLAGAEAAEDGVVAQNYSMYLGEDAAAVPEISLFKEWMAKVDPEQRLDQFGLYAWGAGRLFEQALRAVGPGLTRARALEELAKVNSFTTNGIFSETNPAGKAPAQCFVVIRITGGKFVREHPSGGGFECGMGGFQPYRP